ncbi:MAG: hypothetical protein V4493_12325 [Pseudomonadota bacterium]
MSIFQPVTLVYRDKQYIVKPNEILPLLAQIESVVSLQDLSDVNRLPFAKVAMAYGIALRYAGARVADDEIYRSLFSGDDTHSAAAAVSGLLAMMIPPQELQKKLVRGDTETKKPIEKAKAKKLS